MAGVYPDRGRSLRHLRRSQAVYLYGRFPQRVVLGFDQQLSDLAWAFDPHKIFVLPSGSETEAAGGQ